MRIADLITPERIILGLRAADKAQALALIAARAGARVSIEASDILAALSAREALGSTGLGRGFALPHVRIAGLAVPFGLLVRLARPIDYAAIDEKPVDVLFLLLIPLDGGSQHVTALAAVSRSMRDTTVMALVREATGPASLYDVLVALDC